MELTTKERKKKNTTQQLYLFTLLKKNNNTTKHNQNHSNLIVQIQWRNANKISSMGRKTEKEHELNNNVIVWFILSHKFPLCVCYAYF